MSQSGNTLKVDMCLMSNLFAYPHENKFTPDGYPHNDREGDNMTGMTVGSAQLDTKIPAGKDFDSEAFTTYRTAKK